MTYILSITFETIDEGKPNMIRIERHPEYKFYYITYPDRETFLPLRFEDSFDAVIMVDKLMNDGEIHIEDDIEPVWDTQLKETQFNRPKTRLEDP